MLVMLLVLLLLAACGSGSNEPSAGQEGNAPAPTSDASSGDEGVLEAEKITLYVGPETVSCEGEANQTCLQVKFALDEEWQLFYDTIAGFNYVPGFEYELLVNKTTIANPPADASAIQYALVEVVEETAVSMDDSMSNELIGTQWVVVSYNDQAPINGTDLTLNFEADGLNGSSGCNNYFGSYTIEETKLTISEVGSTLMACMDGALMTQESDFLGLLQAAEAYTLAAGQLTIHTTGGDLVFQPTQNQMLEGPTWVLGSIIQNEVVVSSAVDSQITAIFADGQVAGLAGCNQYSASYTMTDTALTLGPIAATKMACEDERGQREQEFLTAFAAAVSYAIEGESLTLLDANGNELLIFQAQKAG